MNVQTRICGVILVLLCPTGFAQTTDAGDMSNVKTIAVSRGLTETGRNCITCHRDVNPGIVNDWKYSRHGHVGVSCVDCHQVESDSPMAIQHEDVFDMDDYDTSLLDRNVHISTLVPPSTCARCHAAEHEQFANSGHYRSYHQIIPKDNLHALVQVHDSEFGGRWRTFDRREALAAARGEDLTRGEGQAEQARYQCFHAVLCLAARAGGRRQSAGF